VKARKETTHSTYCRALTEYRTSVGGQSTKARIRNQRPIQNIDGNYALNSYLEDMEYFRAYAEADARHAEVV
jgi:hypothetical protein